MFKVQRKKLYINGDVCQLLLIGLNNKANINLLLCN